MATKPMMKKSATKRRFKRYDEGGMTEEDAKRAGLEASKGETVGFLERLRMGNIDDPKSEAYARFGAGRGRAGSPAVKATGTPDMPSSAGDDYEDRISAREASTYRQSDADEAASKKSTSKSAAKPSGGPGRKPSGPAAAGGSGRGGAGGPTAAELRAYSESQRVKLPATGAGAGRGFARPQAPAPEASRPVGGVDQIPGRRRTVEEMAGMPEPTASSTELGRNISNALSAGAGRLPTQVARSIAVNAADKMEKAKALARVRDMRVNKEAWAQGTRGPLGRNPDAAYKKGGKVKAFANGGAVSASKRADGIASRGKTRGKIC